MLILLKNCALVMTDSGGLQKEAYFHNKYCLTLRDETEWVELSENGYNKIVSTNPELIKIEFGKLFSKSIDDKIELYGGGRAVEYIIKILENLE